MATGEPKLHLREALRIFRISENRTHANTFKNTYACYWYSQRCFSSNFGANVTGLAALLNSNCAFGVLLSTKTKAFYATLQFATRTGPGPILYVCNLQLPLGQRASAEMPHDRV